MRFLMRNWLKYTQQCQNGIFVKAWLIVLCTSQNFPMTNSLQGGMIKVCLLYALDLRPGRSRLHFVSMNFYVVYMSNSTLYDQQVRRHHDLGKFAL